MTTLAIVKRGINNNMAALVDKNIAPSTQRAHDAYTKAIKANGAIVKRYTGRLTDKERGELYRHVVKVQQTTGMLLGLWDANGDDIELVDDKPKMPIVAILAANLVLAVLVLAGILFGAVIEPKTVQACEKYDTYTVDDFHGYGMPFGDTYSTVLIVSGVQFDPETYDSCCDLIDDMGREYHLDIAGDGDIEVGDIYSCTMADMGTLDVSDDRIIEIKYQRIDLLMERFNQMGLTRGR